MKKEYIEEVAGRIIEKLKEGTAPWQMPWEPGELQLPYNAVTGKEYRGMNTLWLHMQGYSDPRWMTYNQASAEGAQVRRGSKGTVITYWKFYDERPMKDEQGNPVLDEEGKPRKVRFELDRPRSFSAVVFNAEQIDGLPPLEAKPTTAEPERHARAEAILANSGAKITHVEGNQAFYRPSTDSITLPARHQFKSSDAYYATALHELGHWTGHESRLDRDLAHPFGSEGYAREELRSEVGSLLLGERLGIGHDPEQHIAYVGSWIKVLEDDPREIFRAAADAEKIANYVMAFEQEQVQEQQSDKTTEQEKGSIETNQAVEYNPPEAEAMTPQRTYLIVPYRQKDEAKKLARDAGFRLQWDKEAKQWFAPEGVDIKQTALARWLPENTKRERAPQQTPEQSFADAIRSAGLNLEGLPAMDGEIHRVAVDGDKGGERSGAYAGHIEGVIPGGFIQNYKTGERINWKYEGRVNAVSADDRDRLNREATERAERRATEVAAKHEKMATVAQAIWNESLPATAENPYCAEKGITQPGDNGLRVVPAEVSDEAKAAGVRVASDWREAKAMRAAEPDARVFTTGDLLVPAHDGDGKLWSVQSVNSHFKGFMKDGRKAGLFTVAGAKPSEFADIINNDPSAPLVLAEGYATADTVARLKGHPVIVAFDSGNLDAVARELREKWPDRPLLIAADNDHTKENEIQPNGKLGVNVGLKKAQEAAQNHKGGTLVPPFRDGEKGSDWNDYASQHGDENARRELERQVAQAKTEAIINTERMMSLAREREAEARNDPSTSADDAYVANERAAAHDLMARAVAGGAEVRAEATDALVANANGRSRPVASINSAMDHTKAEQTDEIKEQRQNVLDGHNNSAESQRAEVKKEQATRRRSRNYGAEL